MVTIAREYKTLTGRGLEADLRSEMSFSADQALGLCRVMYEGDGPQVEIGQPSGPNATGATPPVRVTAVFSAETTTALKAFQAAHPTRGRRRSSPETWLADDSRPLVRPGLEVVTSPKAPDARRAQAARSIRRSPAARARSEELNEVAHDPGRPRADRPTVTKSSTPRRRRR
jgi:hypothetical protein